MQTRANVHFLLITILSFCLVQFTFSQKKSFDLDEILKFPKIGDVSISPYGDWVAYTLFQALLAKDRLEANLYVVSTSAENPTTIQLTDGDAQNSQPEWSPDSRWIGYLSFQFDSHTQQIFLVKRTGGKPVKLTEIKTSVSLFRWSPDGSTIAFLSRDSVGSEQKDDAIAVDRDFQMTHLWAVDIPTKSIRRLTEGKFTILDFSWSPDGGSIVFSAQPRPTHPPDYYESDLFLLDVKSLKLRKILSQPGKEISPLWSSDGKWIACVSNGGVYDWIGNEYILVVRAETGESKNLTKDFDEVARIVTWSSDSKWIYFTAAQGTSSHLFRVSIEDGGVLPVTTGPDFYSVVSFTRDTKQFVFLKQNSSSPPEIYTSEIKPFRPQKITSIYSNVQNYWVASTELINWGSKDGKYKIEGFLTKPRDFTFSKKYPLLVIAHGGPPGVFSNIFVLGRLTYPVQLFAQEGFLILQPNVRGSGGYGEGFRKANVIDWGGKDLEDLMAGVDYCIEQGWADPERLGIMGWSYGGYLTAVAISRTQRFKVASIGAGITDVLSYYGTTDVPDFVEAYFGGPPWRNNQLYLERSPTLSADHIVTPTLIQHGEQDDRVPLSQSQELYVALKKRGVPTELIIYPREWHIIKEPKHQRDAAFRNMQWFKKWLTQE